jgi:hypothetical protein
MTIHDTIRTTVMCLTLATTTSQGVAGDRPDGRRGPPPQAIEACANLSEGDACTFDGRNDEELTGVCFAPSEAELACKPEGHDRRQGGKNGNRAGPPDSDQTL